MSRVISTAWRSLAPFEILAKAAEAHLAGLGILTVMSCRGISNRHAKTGAECSNVGNPIIGWDVVNGLPARCALEEEVGHLGDAFERAIAGTEVERCGPVVAVSKGLRSITKPYHG